MPKLQEFSLNWHQLAYVIPSDPQTGPPAMASGDPVQLRSQRTHRGRFFLLSRMQTSVPVHLTSAQVAETKVRTNDQYTCNERHKDATSE